MPEPDERPEQDEDEEQEKPDVEGTGPDYFAGEETIEGVMEELEEKEEE